MPTIVVDDLALPLEQRTLAQHLKTVAPEYEVLTELRESAWIDAATDTIRVFVQTHQNEIVAIGVYAAKKIGDLAVEWAKARFKQHPDNRKKTKMIIYGPDGKPVRTVLIHDATTVEE